MLTQYQFYTKVTEACIDMLKKEDVHRSDMHHIKVHVISTCRNEMHKLRDDVDTPLHANDLTVDVDITRLSVYGYRIHLKLGICKFSVMISYNPRAVSFEIIKNESMPPD